MRIMQTFALTVAAALGLAFPRPLARARPRAKPHTHEEQWRLALAQFAFIADRGRGLHSFRFLHDNYSLTRTEYETLTGLMAQVSVIIRQPRRRARWAPAWNRRKFQRMLHLDQIPLPYPDAAPPTSFFRREGNTEHSAHPHAQA